MFNSFARLALTATAIAPVGFTYSFVALFNNAWATFFWLAGGSTALVFICLAILQSTRSTRAPAAEKHIITTVEPADRENMAIMLLYLMPLFTADFETLNWVMWIPTIIIFAFIAVTSHSYFFNPLLGAFKWHFYRVGTPQNVTSILITKRTIRQGNITIRGIELGTYVIFETE
ncbi:hypothetical protein Q4544_09955 [Cognatishimia sp. 1_MG-2023]|uniref:hypothetical protein n=1 Tax=Cognatishimia sp. 1_MG-2023 TaxID=3062642 RepID=UPI0026E2D07F|nr:hypothetical protein [Cognatishimia sp. 1_MG-2023]MDO6727256.1 hypothetical protein [Cognatishimia sp. 1_MG-2023]